MSAGKYRDTEGAEEDSGLKRASGIGAACQQWLSRIEPRAKFIPWPGESVFHEEEGGWVKRCPRCGDPNPGIRLHCPPCRRIWEERGEI